MYIHVPSQLHCSLRYYYHHDRFLPGAVIFRLEAQWRLIRRTRRVGLGVMSRRSEWLGGLGGGRCRRLVLEHDLRRESSGGVT
jgi:hypothetical protein